MKGPFLSQYLYNDLVSRPSTDIDILVRPQNVFKAGGILKNFGYVEKVELDQRGRKELFRKHYNYKLVHKHYGVPLEIHWKLTPAHVQVSPFVDKMWDESYATTFLDVPTLTLTPENLLLSLCIHLAAHCYGGGAQKKWITDIAKILEQTEELDLSNTIEIAEKLGIKRIVLLCLVLSKKECGISLPKFVEDLLLREQIVVSLANKVLESKFQKNKVELTYFETSVFYFKMRERLNDRLPYIRYVLKKMIELRAVNHLSLFNFPAGSVLKYALSPFVLPAKVIVSPRASLRVFLSFFSS